VKIRTLRILLFPIFVPLFLIGWIVAYSGEPKSETKQAPKPKMQPTEKFDLEVGLLEEENEDLVIA
jgi:hypothetical protein